MTPTRILMALIVVGICLVAAIAKVKTTAPEPSAGGTAQQSLPSSDAIGGAVQQEKGVANITAQGSAGASFSWHSIESGDYRQYVANLRAIGCPEQTLRDIVIADVTKLFAPREQPLKAMLTNRLTGATVIDLNEQRKKQIPIRQQLRAVQLEKNALLQELVGVQLPVDVLRGANSRSYAEFEAAFNALPQGKRELVRDIQETYWQNSDALSEKYRGTNTTSTSWRTPAYLAEYTKLNQERRAAIAKVLTPAELENYDIRITDTGIQMRSEFAGLNVAEEEFRQIFRARREIESPYGGGNLSTGTIQHDAAGNVVDNDADLQSQMNAKIKTTLGDERYAQYEKARDYTYQTLNRLGERFALNSETIDQAYSLQKQLNEQRQTAMRSGTAEERSAKLREIGSDFETRMKQLLGERAAKALQRNYGDYAIYE